MSKCPLCAELISRSPDNSKYQYRWHFKTAVTRIRCHLLGRKKDVDHGSITKFVELIDIMQVLHDFLLQLLSVSLYESRFELLMTSAQMVTFHIQREHLASVQCLISLP